ncbi:threonine dehydratase [Rhodospirillaceae bacterium KN72]|uniref:Threonine dehydratase n=1 Tax=Pacificispira spongiicola TaxID=2729598 RepID=A0A7Y0HE61_9PROT|nr:threonine dehydratase [Pacificispira spongiicola]NMM44375.1 threonine dehydratase [Pacificispira spongiicola]
MPQPTKAQLESAFDTVYDVFKGTPQYSWPLLNQRLDCEIWVKHENHTPVGAFKIRGGLVYIGDRAKSGNKRGVITATRGNHGQSIATACARHGIPCTIVVPEGNSAEKNAAMAAQGGKIVTHGHDFQAAAEHARDRAAADGLDMLPSFHELLVRGVGTYGMELLGTVQDLDTVYVPIGLGSGISGMISARDALGLKTKVVGVVSDAAPAYALSFEAGKPVSTNTADTMADGVACRVPVDEALEIILKGADRIIRVSDDEVRDAMRWYYRDTHNIAEGAGAVPLAGLAQERALHQGKKVGVVLTGGNVDRDVYAKILAEGEV